MEFSYNAYIKLEPNGAGPVRRLPPALGIGAGSAAAGRAGALALGLHPALRFIVKKTITYLRHAYASVYRYSLEVFSCE